MTAKKATAKATTQGGSGVMKFSSNRRVLYEGLENVVRAVAPRTTLPILNNVLLEAKGDQLRLVATDLEMGMECLMPVQEVGEGAVTVPAKVLNEVIGSLPDAEVTLTTDERQVLSINCGKSQYAIHGLPAEEFPGLPLVGKEVTFSTNHHLLREMIKRTAFAASVDETRAMLTGVLVIWNGKELKLVATDTYRMAIATSAVEGEVEQEVRVIVPARAMHELQRLLDGGEEAQVRVSIGENQVQFDFDHLRLVSRLIEGQFPNFERVVPENNEKFLYLKRVDLLTALRRAHIMARAEASKLIFRTQDGLLTIKAESPELGMAYEEIEARLQGEAVEIAFNAEYLIQALSVMEAEEVEFGLSGAFNPGVLKPSGDPGYLYMVMPMQML